MEIRFFAWTTSLPYVAALLLCVVPGFTPVVAQQSCTVPAVNTHDDAVAALDGLRGNHCLGGNACETNECQLVAQLEQSVSGKDASTAGDKVLAVLRKLNDVASALDPKGLAVPQLQSMTKRWSMPSLSATPQTIATKILTSNVKEWQGRQLFIFLHTSFEVDFGDQLCKPLPPANGSSMNPACATDLTSAIAVYTLCDLFYRTLSTVTEEKIADIGKMLKTYDERWTAFHTKSLAVLPWELVANNLSYRSAAHGFSGPPDYQWLLLHPSAAVVYDSRQNDKLQPAVLLDLVGRYQWTWGGPNQSDITRPWGAAAAMSWHGGSPGYGLSLHLPNNWSAAVTRSAGNKWQFIVSAEFAQFITDKQKNIDEIRADLEKIRLQ